MDRKNMKLPVETYDGEIVDVYGYNNVVVKGSTSNSKKTVYLKLNDNDVVILNKETPDVIATTWDEVIRKVVNPKYDHESIINNDDYDYASYLHENEYFIKKDGAILTNQNRAFYFYTTEENEKKVFILDEVKDVFVYTRTKTIHYDLNQAMALLNNGKIIWINDTIKHWDNDWIHWKEKEMKSDMTFQEVLSWNNILKVCYARWDSAIISGLDTSGRLYSINKSSIKTIEDIADFCLVRHGLVLKYKDGRVIKYSENGCGSVIEETSGDDNFQRLSKGDIMPCDLAYLDFSQYDGVFFNKYSSTVFGYKKTGQLLYACFISGRYEVLDTGCYITCCETDGYYSYYNYTDNELRNIGNNKRAMSHLIRAANGNVYRVAFHGEGLPSPTYGLELLYNSYELIQQVQDNLGLAVDVIRNDDFTTFKAIIANSNIDKEEVNTLYKYLVKYRFTKYKNELKNSRLSVLIDKN